MPKLPFKHHHASCALACAGHALFGLESAGSFCMCLSKEEAAAAVRLNERECHPPCSSSSRVHRTGKGWGPEPLPCGGSEAVALFDTQPFLDAMAGAASERERGRLTEQQRRRQQQRSHLSPAEMQQRPSRARPRREMCQPMAEPCASPLGSAAARSSRRVRTLYVHAPTPGGGTPARSGLVPDHRVILGCFADDELQRAGVSHVPSTLRKPPGSPGEAAGEGHDELAMRCSAGCTGYKYFAVGHAGLVGGPCLCGNMETVSWRRDAVGIEPLKQRSLRRSG